MVSGTKHYSFVLLRKYKTSFILVSLILIAEMFVSLLFPKLVGRDIISLQKEGFSENTFLSMASTWIAIVILQGLLRYLSSVRLGMLGANITAYLNSRLFEHIQKLPMSYFHHTPKGNVLALLTHDLGSISFYITNALTTLAPNFLILIGSVGLMMSISPHIGTIILVSVPLMLLLIKVVGKKAQPLAKDIVDIQSEALALASESIETINLIKTSTREQAISKDYSQYQAKLEAVRTLQFRYQSFLGPMVQVLALLILISVLSLFMLQYHSGNIELAELIALLLYGLIFIRPVNALAGLYGQTQHVRAAIERLQHIWGQPTENYTNTLELSKPLSRIEFSNLSFAYSAEHPILTNVSFSVSAGETLLIIGENGQGKSTIFNLILQLYKPVKGTVLLNHVDSQSYGVTQIRQCIGYVPQNVKLQTGTVFSNIVLGKPAASEKEVAEAAKKAGLSSIIGSLPKGMYTQVGEGGVRLSGGQKQRIALARALIKSPDVLLLDEPTSMLDDMGKKHFKYQFADLFKDYVLVIISHDPVLKDIASKVCYLKNGTLTDASNRIVNNAL